MKSTFIWLILVGAVLLFGNSVNAWNRQFFNRYSRNLFRNGVGVNAPLTADAGNSVGGGGGAVGVGSGVGGSGVGIGMIGIGDGVGGGSGFNGGGGGGGVGIRNTQTGKTIRKDFNALFGIGNVNEPDVRVAVNAAGLGNAIGMQQQPEVYGIVEPLIEDTPCVDRPCNVNNDCCPTGVCVNTYGEGKCVYVYGRQRDLCHRNSDCEPGMLCVKSSAGNLACQQTLRREVIGINAANAYEVKQFGEECVTSNDCNLSKGMCCQLQRNHHRILPKKLCAYFRDPFMCIDIMPTEDEEIRESRFLSSFRQRRM